MQDVAKTFDLRSCIFGTFFRVGFEWHELSSQEKQTLEIIKLFPYLKNGEIWRDIRQELEDNNLKATSDDGHWMETCIEESLEQTQQAVVNQKKYAEEIREKEQADLDTYFTAIRFKNSVNQN